MVNVLEYRLFRGDQVSSFPDDFFFEGSRSAAFKQIGNAVPVKLAEAIGRGIMKFVK